MSNSPDYKIINKVDDYYIYKQNFLKMRGVSLMSFIMINLFLNSSQILK